MFLRLISIESTRLARRAWPWLTLAACALFLGLSLENFYTFNRPQLLNGGLKLPGVSFDLANSLDQLALVALPFWVILAANQVGGDYAQRTNQHWLMRAPRHSGLLAKFTVLAAFMLITHWLGLLAGLAVGWYFKTFLYQSYSLANLNPGAALLAPLYMTLSSLPYLALLLLLTVATRSSFAGAAIGLGYTQFIEMVLTGLFHGKRWMMWSPHNLAVSVSYLLNGIGNRVVEIPATLARPLPAMLGSLAYTLLFLAAALWLYRRQDLG